MNFLMKIRLKFKGRTRIYWITFTYDNSNNTIHQHVEVIVKGMSINKIKYKSKLIWKLNVNLILLKVHSRNVIREE